jgi:hypothetical protein
MRESTDKLLTDWAIAYAKAKFPKPNWEAIAKSEISQSITLAISIYRILKNGDWVTSTQITAKLDKGLSYVRKVLKIVKIPFGLSSDRGKGWRLEK